MSKFGEQEYSCIHSMDLNGIKEVLMEHINLENKIIEVVETTNGDSITVVLRCPEANSRFYLQEFPGNCGILLWSNLPYYKFKEILPGIEELAIICGYNTLLITDIEDNIKIYTDCGFTLLFSNFNVHSRNTICIFAKNMFLSEDCCYYDEEDDYYDDEEDDYYD